MTSDDLWHACDQDGDAGGVGRWLRASMHVLTTAPYVSSFPTGDAGERRRARQRAARAQLALHGRRVGPPPHGDAPMTTDVALMTTDDALMTTDDALMTTDDALMTR